MAVAIASKEMQAHGLSGSVVGTSESFLEVLARVLFRQPAALQLLLQGQDPKAEARFVEWWIRLASARYCLLLPVSQQGSVLAALPCDLCIKCCNLPII